MQQLGTNTDDPCLKLVSRCDCLRSFDRRSNAAKGKVLYNHRWVLQKDADIFSYRKDDKLPSSLRASKRGDVESIWFPVILYRAKTSHYCYFITWYPLFLTLFCFPVLVAIIPRLQSNTEQHATTYCQENDAVSLHLSTATAGLGQKF